MSERVAVSDLLGYYQLGEDVCNQQVTDRHLDEIASSYCRRWKSLRAELGLKAIVEHDIDHSIPGDEEGKRHALFSKWKLMKGSSATYKELISALLRIKCRDDAEGVCKVLKQSLANEERSCQPIDHDCQATCQANQQDSSTAACHSNEVRCKGADDLSLQQKMDHVPQTVSSCTEASCSAVAPLDPEVREDLVHILRLNRKRIITQYARYVSSVCDCVVNRGVSVQSLCTFLLELPAFVSDEDENQGRLLSGVQEKLEKADTIYNVFNLLRKECASFLNYDIYESIQNKFCTEVECEDFKYPDRLKAYIDGHNVKEFFDVNPQLEKVTEASIKLCLKLDIEVTSKVAKVVNLKSSVAALLGLKPSALRLFSVEEGCVIVTFLIPAFVADIIFATGKMITMSKGFQDLSVLWIKCGDFKFDFGGQEPEYPEQIVVHRITCDFLTVGSDGHYYQFRDYNANDNMILDGSIGSVRFAEDLSSNHLFAIKCNKRDDDSIIELIETEARLLSRLGPHTNVIQMYGAVLDCQEHEFLPTRIFKLFMELSQHGNLAEMVVDPDTSEPFPLDRDQALFYFWQVLKGVDFLHKNNVLHLDIKGSNILVFDEGRTLKICDFDTAVSVDEVASRKGKTFGGTLQFSAPEICRQEMPHFSSDMWSTMCVLVEILTGKKPWHSFSSTLNCLIYRIAWYKDEQMETELLPPGAKIDADLIDLMRSVFHAEGKERASASQLLQHPLIVSAYTYEACFDEVLEEDGASMEDDCAPVDEEVGYISHASCAPSSLTLALNPPDYTLPGHLLEGQADMKRLSKDCGTADLDQDITASYGRMSSCGRGSDSALTIPLNHQDYQSKGFGHLLEGQAKVSKGSGALGLDHSQMSSCGNSESGLDTPYTADRLILSSSSAKFSFATHPKNSAEMIENGNVLDRHMLRSQSLPDVRCDPINKIQRSFSFDSHSTSMQYPFQAPVGSTNGNVVPQKRQHPYPWSYGRLRHSNSAPIIGNDRRRRLSLQSLRSYGTDEHSNGKLRRISSEIYVDGGPDIDSPDRVRTLEDVSSWAQNVQKEFSLAQGPSDEQECDPLAAGHTPSAEDGPLVMRMLSQSQKEDRNCSSHDTRVNAQQVDVVAKAESAAGTGASRTEIEKHVTTQGRTFDVYKTVC